jgi:hypothetical protein
MTIAPERNESVIEFTTRAVVAGIFFGILFLVGIVSVVGICALLYRAGRSAAAEGTGVVETSISARV